MACVPSSTPSVFEMVDFVFLYIVTTPEERIFPPRVQRRLIALGLNGAGARNQLGVTYLMGGRVGEARGVFEGVLGVWPGDGLAMVGAVRVVLILQFN